MAKIYVTLAIEAKDKLEAGATAKLIKEHFVNVSDIDTISTEKPIQLDDICEKIEEYFDGEYSLDTFKENYRNKVERSCSETRKEAPEMVDLGLPSGTLWADCNLGAAKPEEYGNYYAWGDTKGYKASEISDKFTPDWYRGLQASTIDSDLNSTNDIATLTLGSKYNIPTNDECHELIDNTTQTVETLNGVKGMRFTGNNGNSIFVPFAGYCFDGSLSLEGIYALLWSASRRPNFDNACYLDCRQNGNVSVYGDSRCYGRSVRAVARS